jgi:hypothetical protein
MLANDPVWQNLRPHRLAALIAWVYWVQPALLKRQRRQRAKKFDDKLRRLSVLAPPGDGHTLWITSHWCWRESRNRMKKN